MFCIDWYDPSLLLLLLLTAEMMFTIVLSRAIANDRKANWEFASLF